MLWVWTHLASQDAQSSLGPPSTESYYAILYCYWLESSILHALSAELRRGNQRLISTRPLHCSMLTGQALQLHLQSLLESFNHYSTTPIRGFRDIVDVSLADSPCPVAGCALNLSSLPEELL